jgi:hypothetical protein
LFTLISVIYIIRPKIYIISCLEFNVQFVGMVLSSLSRDNNTFTELVLEASTW